MTGKAKITKAYFIMFEKKSPLNIILQSDLTDR